MTIENDDEYQRAVERLTSLSDDLEDGAKHDEFFAISAAMVDYETRQRHDGASARG